MRALGVGAFHAAVQIGDMEWSFGYTPPWAGETTGVFACPVHSTDTQLTLF